MEEFKPKISIKDRYTYKQIDKTYTISIPKNLEYIEDDIITEIQNKIEFEIKSAIDKFSTWHSHNIRVLECKHRWVTNSERTSTYDTEKLTRCVECGVNEDVLNDIMLKYRNYKFKKIEDILK